MLGKRGHALWARFATRRHRGSTPGESHLVRVIGDVHLGSAIDPRDAVLDGSYGSIVVHDGARFGYRVSLLSNGEGGSSGDIVIGARVELGTNSVVLAPAVLYEGAIVAPGATVRGEVTGRSESPPVEAIPDSEPGGLPADAVLADTDVGILALHADCTTITPEITSQGSWEPAESNWLRGRIPTGGVVVDVGANVGYHTLLAAAAVGPTGRVFALEPGAANFRLLVYNLRRSGMSDRATAICAAAWRQSGEVRLALSPGNTGDHRCEALTACRPTLRVPAFSLDDLFPPGAHVDLIKIDAQGSDHRVLEGAAGILSRSRPLVLCEFWPRGIRDLGDDPCNVLAAIGGGHYDWEVIADGPALDPWELARVDSSDEFVTLALTPVR